MKKLLSIIAALLLVLTLSIAAAEKIPEINWADFESAYGEMGLGTDFVTLDEIAVKFWLPSVFVPIEIEDEYKYTEEEGGLIACYSTENDIAGIIVSLNALDCNDLTEYAALMADKNPQDEEYALINGLGAYSYTLTDDPENQYVAFVSESGKVLEFLFYPVTDEDFAACFQFVTASIQPE